MNPIDKCRVEGYIFKHVLSKLNDFDKAASFTFSISESIATEIDEKFNGLAMEDAVEKALVGKMIG